jgi:hypothetical protein
VLTPIAYARIVPAGENTEMARWRDSSWDGSHHLRPSIAQMLKNAAAQYFNRRSDNALAATG